MKDSNNKTVCCISNTVFNVGRHTDRVSETNVNWPRMCVKCLEGGPCTCLSWVPAPLIQHGPLTVLRSHRGLTLIIWPSVCEVGC